MRHAIHARSKARKVGLDSKNRVALTPFLPSYKVDSFRVYVEDDKIILEPLAEIPARELWLYQNPAALKSVLKGLDQSKKGEVEKLDVADLDLADENE